MVEFPAYSRRLKCRSQDCTHKPSNGRDCSCVVSLLKFKLTFGSRLLFLDMKVGDTIDFLQATDDGRKSSGR